MNEKVNDTDINYINNEIKKQINKDILNDLKDKKLLNEYLKCKSVNNSIDKLVNILKDINIEEKKINEIKTKYILELIPAGTKGIIRGNKFNEIVKNYINNLNLDKKIYEIKFETNCDNVITDERPDCYIKNIKNNKVIIIMNQLDLWKKYYILKYNL